MKFPPLAEQCCDNCRYSRSAGPVLATCHRTAPQASPRGAQWPTVDRLDWCGEWAAVEANR